MSEIATGACLCGSIQIELQGKPSAAVVCYCHDCRKNSGNLGQFCARMDFDDVTVLDPNLNLALFEIVKTTSGVPKQKQFCRNCGCTIQVLLGLDAGYSYVRPTLLDEGYIGVFEPQEALFPEVKKNYTGSECLYF